MASAYAAQQMRRAAEYGIVSQSPVRADMRQVKARKDKIVADRREGLRTEFSRAPITARCFMRRAASYRLMKSMSEASS